MVFLKPKFLIRVSRPKMKGPLKSFDIMRNLLKTMFAITRVHCIRPLDVDIYIDNIDTWVWTNLDINKGTLFFWE